MNEWWMALSGLQQAMFVIGSATLLFMIVQIIMMCIGMGGHDVSVEADLSGLSDVGDVDVGGLDADVDVGDVGDLDTADADMDVGDASDCGHVPHMGAEIAALGMRLLSVRCILAFLCFGSWVTFIFDEYLEWYFACLIGVGAGFVAAVIMALVMNEIMKLQRDGTVKMKNCIGKEAEVYLTVPPLRSGKGKVNILVQEKLMEFDAVTDDDEPIATGETVKTVKAEESTLVVERARDKNRQSRYTSDSDRSF